MSYKVENWKPRYKPKTNSLARAGSDIDGSSNSKFYELELGEVIDIIYDDTHSDFQTWDDIGKVKVRLLYSQYNVEEKDLKWAKPFDARIKAFPLKHELVLTGYYVSNMDYSLVKIKNSNYLNKELYYTKTISCNNSVNNNAFYNISAQDGGKPYVDLGNKFESDDRIHPLLQQEGDTTWEGRFGQSIRFGSNENVKLPNIKIRVGQNKEYNDLETPIIPVKEDINLDNNSIWITTDEIVSLDRACKDTVGFNGDEPNLFDSNQIIINSDRIIFNSKVNEILAYSNTNIGLSANKNVIINSKKTIVNSKEVELGLDANEQLVLGNVLKSWLESLIDELSKTTVPTGTGPSGVPINVLGFVKLKTQLNTILSKTSKTL